MVSPNSHSANLRDSAVRQVAVRYEKGLHMLHPLGDSAGAVLALIFVLGILFAAAAWVYTDARMHSRRGNPIVVSIGLLHIRTPAGWFFACLLLAELFLPLYVDSREIA